MNADVAKTLIVGQKIKYWDERIATVTVAYTPPVAVMAAEEGTETFAVKGTEGEIGIVFDEMPDPKPVHYVLDRDLRMAEPL
jgi:hypothetical protein